MVMMMKVAVVVVILVAFVVLVGVVEMVMQLVMVQVVVMMTANTYGTGDNNRDLPPTAVVLQTYHQLPWY
jgi:hypothetical protein